MARRLPPTKRARRVLLVADTHGDVDARVAAIAAGCDVVVHAGDIGNAGVIERLRPRRGRFCAVLGNNDVPAKWPARDRPRLARIPDELQLDLPGGVLVVVHGDRVRPASSRHQRLRKRYPAARAVVYGHTHRLVCDRMTTPWVLNPGAGGKTRTFGGASCLVLRVSARRWRLDVYGKGHRGVESCSKQRLIAKRRSPIARRFR